MFQIVHSVLDDKNEVVARRTLRPLFELWEDATAMAEFELVSALGRLRL